MPEATPSIALSKRLRLREAARNGMMISMKCALCRREVNYWAHDLIQVLGPEALVDHAPWPCSRCSAPDMLSVRCVVPSASDIATGNIIVRRPVKQVLRWIWRDEKA